MFSGKEWGTVIRFWADNLPSAFKHYAIGEGGDRQQRLETTAGPMIPATGIIMFVSLAERLALDALQAHRISIGGDSVDTVRLTDGNMWNELGVDTSWDGWRVISGLVALRHCFAHEYGRVTARQHSNVTTFHSELSSGALTVTIQKPNGSDSTTMQSFYSIDSDQNIVCSATIRTSLWRQLEFSTNKFVIVAMPLLKLAKPLTSWRFLLGSLER